MELSIGQQGVTREYSEESSSPFLLCSSPPVSDSSPMLMARGSSPGGTFADSYQADLEEKMRSDESGAVLDSWDQHNLSSPLLPGSVLIPMELVDKQAVDCSARDEYSQLVVRTVTQLIDLILRTSISSDTCLSSKKVQLSRSATSQTLSSFAPSMFLPGYAEVIAFHIPLISRMVASLANITKRSASGYEARSTPRITSQLWLRLDSELRKRYAGNRLKRIKYALPAEHDASQLIDANQEISPHDHHNVDRQYDLFSSSDEDWMINDDGESHSDEASMLDNDLVSDLDSMLDDASADDFSQEGIGLHSWQQDQNHTKLNT